MGVFYIFPNFLTKPNRVALFIIISALAFFPFNCFTSAPKTDSTHFILNDDFEHGTLSGWFNTADWSNSDVDPINGERSLKHEQGDGISYIRHPLENENILSDTISWRFSMKNGNWIPSANNKFWFFLYSDEEDIATGQVNGYAAGVNMTGNDDYLKIWEVTDGLPAKTVISSDYKWGSGSMLAIEVKRTPEGEWELKYNEEGEFRNFTSAGKAVAHEHTEAEWCGLVFVYTPTRAGLLWLDDVYSGPPIPDTIPPFVTGLEALTPHLAELSFSEKVDSESALNPENYILNNNVNPVEVNFVNSKFSKVHLYFNEPFTCSEANYLTIENICDPAGNVMEPETVQFKYESLRISDIRIISDNRLRLMFTKPLKESTATDINNYLLDPGGIKPYSATTEIGNPQAVLLSFQEHFIQKGEYTLLVQNTEDLHGNKIEPVEKHIVYYRANPLDVVINEIMARPGPPVGLPEFEYVELHNRTDYPVDLGSWTLAVGNRTRSIPYTVIAPGEYLTLCDPDAESALSVFGPVAAIENFPLIPMGGQTILLQDNEGNIISAISYCESWYKSDYKAAGGWSLEQIDPDNPCGGKENWTASVHISGGTPGAANSVKDINPDNSRPELVRAATLTDSTVRLFFSEPLHPSAEENPGYYSASHNAGEPLSVFYLPPHFTEADLQFSKTFEKNSIYTVTVENGLYDCAGNPVKRKSSAKFALPEKPEKGDVIINEVLFNPPPGGVEFIELYNRSDKVIDLFDMVLAEKCPDTGTIDPAYPIAPGRYLLFPGEYVVLTTCRETIKRYYETPGPFVFAEMERVTKLNNDEGRVIIADRGLDIIDDFSYREDMHHPLLTDFKGVSLERLNFNRPASDQTNWHSASENSGFATPGYINSQFIQPGIEIKGEILVEPEIFSPDNTGYNDVANIVYNFGKPGYLGTITIYDSKGRLVRRLVRNKLLGTSGTFSWDGRNEANSQSKMGIYIIHTEVFHPEGAVKHYKTPVVLGARLR